MAVPDIGTATDALEAAIREMRESMARFNGTTLYANPMVTPPQLQQMTAVEVSAMRDTYVDTYGTVYNTYTMRQIGLLAGDELAEWNRREDERRLAAERARLVAAKRAQQLLMSHLTKAQRKQYDTDYAFGVVGSLGNMYMIYGSGHVYGFHSPRTVVSYCYQPSVTMPEADVVLAKKWILEANEAEFLHVAVASNFDALDPYESDTVRRLRSQIERLAGAIEVERNKEKVA